MDDTTQPSVLVLNDEAWADLAAIAEVYLEQFEPFVDAETHRRITLAKRIVEVA